MQDDSQQGLVVFSSETGEIALNLDRDHNTIWATQAQIAALFGCTDKNVIQHIGNIYDQGELDREGTSKKFLLVQDEGTRQVSRNVQHFNLDMILSIGYRVNSKQATKFRQWATKTLSDYVINGFTINEARLSQDREAQLALANALRKIRTSEVNMYEKVREVFKQASIDYDKDSHITRTFFAMAQDKFHYAVTQRTAAQIVLERASASKPNLGMTIPFEGVPATKVAQTAKNYLSAEELHGLENICEQWLLFAEAKAFRGQKMTMEELSFKLNTLLTANDYPVLYEYGRYRRGEADAHVKTELQKYRALNEPSSKPAIKAPSE